MKSTSRIRAFSLVELVIVVVIIGVIAAIAVPRISRGAKGAGDSSLRGSLAGIRNAIDMYAAEHGGDFPADAGADTETTLIDQLTKKTDALGNVGVTAGVHIYGPYLRSGFPRLSVCNRKGDKTVSLIAAGPPAPTGLPAGTGWVYAKDTGEFVANCAAAEQDDQNVPYNTY